MTADCCPGEALWGWPGALHSEDCPVYLRWADAHVARTRARMEAERRAPQPSATELAYRAGYAAGLRARRGDTPVGGSARNRRVAR